MPSTLFARFSVLLLMLLLFPGGLNQAWASPDNPGLAASVIAPLSPQSQLASGEVPPGAGRQVMVEVVTREQAGRQEAMASQAKPPTSAVRGAGKSLPRLKGYLGKYPYESAERDRRVGLRLRQLFAEKYPLYKKISTVQNTIEGTESFIVLHGCKAHQCDSHNVIVMLWEDGFSQALTTEDYSHSTYYGPPLAGPADVEREKRFLKWIRGTKISSACKDNIEQIEAALSRRW
jgi:hypothetical protein